MKDIAKAAALGVVVGAGMIGGMYIGGKIVSGSSALYTRTKDKFAKDKTNAQAAKPAAA
jgi:hypothetical protein